MKNSTMFSKIVMSVKSSLAIACLFGAAHANAQVLIADTDVEPDANAIVDVNSTTKGFLWPRLTSLEMDAISNPTEGLVVYNADTQIFYGWNGTKWVNLGLDSAPANTNPNILQFEPGDFAFTAIKSDNPDEFSMIPLKAVPAGQVFYITDCGVMSDGVSFRLNEGALRWEVTNLIEPRTEIHFEQLSANTSSWTTTQGNLSAVMNTGGQYGSTFNQTGLGLTLNGDQIIFFTATSEDAPLLNVDKFITALSLESGWINSGETSASDQSYIPNGLTPNIDAVTLDQSGDNKHLNCNSTPSLQSMTIEELRTYINNVNNWNHTDTSGSAVVPSGCTF